MVVGRTSKWKRDCLVEVFNLKETGNRGEDGVGATIRGCWFELEGHGWSCWGIRPPLHGWPPRSSLFRHHPCRFFFPSSLPNPSFSYSLFSMHLLKLCSFSCISKWVFLVFPVSSLFQAHIRILSNWTCDIKWLTPHMFLGKMRTFWMPLLDYIFSELFFYLERFNSLSWLWKTRLCKLI